MSEISSATLLETAKKLGLSEEEYEKICGYLGRPPNFTELSIYSVMWSEHCSYKNSIVQLKTLPRSGSRLLVEAGEENAGLVDIGDGLACAFKIESHNHPSCIEPFQGAATGVGGIHRDIFTMGARPIASLNSLRFGNLSEPNMRRLLKGVVEGIGHYGNCFGVPTVGGEIYFNDCYNQNILVNAMSVGIVKVGETISAVAKGVGNPIFIVGSSTGKDGIHGATFASGDLDEHSAKQLPSVQVGDPFQEKLLLEASLEVIQTGVVIGMQDMGAAGITCSTNEMAAREGFGMRIDLSKVPQRQEGMKGWEILLSESQERMLVVVQIGEEKKILDIFEKWDLPCVQIGEVTEGGILEYYHDGVLVAKVPADSLVLGGGAPVYVREFTTPEYLKKINKFNIDKIEVPKKMYDTALQLWRSPNIASKRWVYEQYDSTVRAGTMSTHACTDASVVRVPETKKALAVTTDCNSVYVFADPYKGAMIAVCEAARNILSSGGEPLAITNCLNFGNPYNTEVYYQFVNAIKGMGDACRALNTPVTGGNVSFYNQTVYPDGKTVPIYPTPTIGMLGILENYNQRQTLNFKNVGDLIILIGNSQNDISCSEYLRTVVGVEFSPAPHFILEEEILVHNAIREINKSRLANSVHDVADGGLFCALLECAMPNDLGFTLTCNTNFRKDAFLFGEAQSRFIISISPEDETNLHKLLEKNKVPYSVLGSVSSELITIDEEEWGITNLWKKIHNRELERRVKNLRR